MEKFKNFIPTGILLAYMVKMTLNTSSLSDAGIIFGLVGLIALQSYLEKQKSVQEINDFVMNKIKEQESVISKQNDLLAQFAVEFTKVKNEMAGVKLKSDFATNTNFGKKVA